MDSILEILYKWSKESVVDEILIFAALISLIETYAQSNLKGGTMIVGLVFYAMIGYILHFAYNKFPLSKMNVTWSCISIILATFLGYILYKEPLDNWKILSVVSALFAIYFASQSQ
jgi:multidrug transporter EmrE-like cation transporter